MADLEFTVCKIQLESLIIIHFTHNCYVHTTSHEGSMGFDVCYQGITCKSYKLVILTLLVMCFVRCGESFLILVLTRLVHLHVHIVWY